MTNCHQQGSERIDRSRQKNYNWKHSIALCKTCFTDTKNALKIKLLRVHSLLYFPNKPIYQPINSDNQWARRQVDWETFVSKCPVEGETKYYNWQSVSLPYAAFSAGRMCQTFCFISTATKQQEAMSDTHFLSCSDKSSVCYIYFFDKLWTNCN